MGFEMKRPHKSRADNVLYAWGEFKRIERDDAAPNGLQVSSVYRERLGARLGDQSEFLYQQVEGVVLLMIEIQREYRDWYRYAEHFFVKRKRVSDLPGCERNRCYRSLDGVRRFVFIRMWPEVVEVEERLALEGKLNRDVYDWSEAKDVTTGKRDAVRLVEKVVVYQK